ncbi:DUF4176 domain-containing protein [Fictibacillus phosphorivorans]|uniref:DUF4176 domain-containing protein n=1 Tax=Fictibacillus phosphorivorans TaxID=1221500 RepID=UPI0035E60774
MRFMKNQNLLPNGSIVLLTGANKKLMIYGRKQLVISDEEIEYDYISVPYPEGHINEEHTYVFNHSDIEKIIFRGYENEEEFDFQAVLNTSKN